MSFNLIDKELWTRKEYFDYYIKFIKTNYNLNVNIDITEILKFVKSKNIKFYPVFLYAVSTAINKNKEFRFSYDSNGNLGYWDELHPQYTIFHDDDKTFSDIWTYYNNSFSVFYNDVLDDMKKYKNIKGIKPKPDKPENFCPISCLPWLSFTGYSNNSYADDQKMLFPVILFGKYFEFNGKTLIPFSVFINHAVADGYHTSKLINDIQEISNNFKSWLQI